MSEYKTLRGVATPLGNRVREGGTNFALFSANAQGVELCLFSPDGTQELARLPMAACTGDIWHCFVPDVGEGQLYGYRVHGPYSPADGHRFNPHKLLIDPYAKILSGDFIQDDALFGFDRHHPDKDLSFDTRDSAPFVPKAVVGEIAPFKRATNAPAAPMDDAVIYEAHVKGLTINHPGVPKRLRGTFEGLAAPKMIAHMKKLGVTSIELLPVHAFADEPRLAAMGLSNYWGYNSINFFAPHGAYLGPVGIAGFQKMVRAMHKAGIEVILDVVYNHTAESWELGQTLSMRGIDNASYYRLADDRRYYSNETGCGNALNMENPHVLKLVMDSLRYWVEVMGVDGFRFDLATTLARVHGSYDGTGPFLQALRQDPVLSMVKLIAEPWDIGDHGYQLGSFPDNFHEWNDRYRDTVRRFWRGEPGVMPDLADALLGSASAFEHAGNTSSRSVNYITAHDGFTLMDLVSYNERHNEANGEEGRDGHSHNSSDNCGVEGASDDPDILARRRRRMRSLLATLFLSQGTPMLLAGDELGNSQHGNNNAYCQDNDTSWLLWDGPEADWLPDFVAKLSAIRQAHPVLRRPHFLHGEDRSESGLRDVTWLDALGCELHGDAWHDPGRHTLGMMLCGEAGSYTGPYGEPRNDKTLLVIVNNGHDDAAFALPLTGAWDVLLDTNTADDPAETPVADTVTVGAGSLLLLACDGKGVNRLAAADAIGALARHYGVIDGFYDLSGTHHTAGLETKAALLSAMDVETDTAEALKAAQERQRAEESAALPPTLVLRKNALNVPLRLPFDIDAATADWAVTLEDGTRREGVSSLVPAGNIDHECGLQRHMFELPADLPLGYHTLSVRGPVTASCFLVVAPETAETLETGGKGWGLMVPLYGLTSGANWGIGDYDDLGRIAEYAAAEGADFLGLNPVHALFTRVAKTPSPYSPSSRTFLNILHIAPHLIPELADDADGRVYLDELFASDAVKAARASQFVDYAAVIDIKFKAYAEAFRHFEALPEGHARRLAFDSYCDERGDALAAHALFDVLSEHFLAQDPELVLWQDWPAAYRNHGSDEVQAFANANAGRVRFYMYLQWLADLQLEAAQARAKAAGMAIGLYLDMAVGMVPGGAETWSGFRSVATGVSLGAPPDAASPAGQVWQLAPLNPHRLQETGYRHFIETLRAIMSRSGLVRIDHILGINRSYWCPTETDVPGAYVAYPLDDLIGIIALESRRAGCAVIGEDLGTVPDGLRPKLNGANISGCALMYFEQDHDGRYLEPHEYRAPTLASISNHDFPTLAGFWAGEDFGWRRELGIGAEPERLAHEEAKREADKTALMRLLESEGLLPEGFSPDRPGDTMVPALSAALHRLLGRTNSLVAAVQIEDLLDLKGQPNVPGTTDEQPNWRRKIPLAIEDLDSHTGAAALIHAVRRGRQENR